MQTKHTAHSLQITWELRSTKMKKDDLPVSYGEGTQGLK